MTAIVRTAVAFATRSPRRAPTRSRRLGGLTILVRHKCARGRTSAKNAAQAHCATGTATRAAASARPPPRRIAPTRFRRHTGRTILVRRRCKTGRTSANGAARALLTMGFATRAAASARRGRPQRHQHPQLRPQPRQLFQRPLEVARRSNRLRAGGGTTVRTKW